MTDEFYREQAEALIADLRARVSHYEARIAEQMEDEVSEDDLRAFIVDAVRANDSLPQALRKTYRITLRYQPGRTGATMTSPRVTTHTLTPHREPGYDFAYWTCDTCPGVFAGQDAHDEAVAEKVDRAASVDVLREVIKAHRPSGYFETTDGHRECYCGEVLTGTTYAAHLADALVVPSEGARP